MKVGQKVCFHKTGDGQRNNPSHVKAVHVKVFSATRFRTRSVELTLVVVLQVLPDNFIIPTRKPDAKKPEVQSRPDRGPQPRSGSGKKKMQKMGDRGGRSTIDATRDAPRSASIWAPSKRTGSGSTMPPSGPAMPPRAPPRNDRNRRDETPSDAGNRTGAKTVGQTKTGSPDKNRRSDADSNWRR